MGRRANKILAAVAFLMVAAVIAAVAYSFLGNNKDGSASKGGFTYSQVGYEAVGSYAGGLAPVQIYKLWGYADKDGKVIIVPQFSEAGQFSSEVAAVKESKGELYGYINNGGEYVIEPQFAYAGRFSEGLAACKEDKKGKLGYINKAGDFVIKPQYSEAAVFSNGLAKVRTSSGLYGYIDKTGTMVIQDQFEAGTDFSNGLAAVMLKGSWKFIDKTGKPAFDGTFAKAHGYSGDLAAVETTGSWGFIDRKGKLVIPNDYFDAGDFDGNYAPVKFKDSSLWGYIDKSGKAVIDGKYKQAKAFSYGVASYQEKDKWMLLTDTKYVAASTDPDSSNSGNTAAESKKPETISNKNITNLIKEIKIHANESAQLSGLIKTGNVIEKLVLSVIGEDGGAKGVYLTVKPDANKYDLEEVSVDGKIEPFNVQGKYKLQIWAKLKGATQEAKIGEVGVEVLGAEGTGSMAVDIGNIDGSKFPEITAYATVADKTGNPMTNLAASNFKLYEAVEGKSEAEQSISSMKLFHADEGLGIALVLDSSLSMYNKDKSEKNSKMAAAKDAAIKFVGSNQFSTKDKLAIYSFGKKFTVNQSFTLNKNDLTKAVKSIKSQPDTAIFDAVAKSVQLMTRVKGRKCIIILSDGADISSKLTYRDAISKAVTAKIPIYSIALGQEGKTNEFKSISEKTGGAFYYLKDPKMLNEIYKAITDKQKNQYQLVYKSTTGTAADKTRKVKLVVTSGSDNASIEKGYKLK